jgi:hypothetical protein
LEEVHDAGYSDKDEKKGANND